MGYRETRTGIISMDYGVHLSELGMTFVLSEKK
jgi:hypothetical protein